MKAAETDILILPGLGGGAPGHWYHRWQPKLSTANVVAQDDWDAPDRDAWTGNLQVAIAAASRPVVLIAHSLGVLTVAHALSGALPGAVHGAFLVAPPDPQIIAKDFTQTSGFAPAPDQPLPFPALCIASRTDMYCRYEVAETMAKNWGAILVDAGDSGHLNDDSGHGPWPEGTFLFAKFIAGLQINATGTDGAAGVASDGHGPPTRH